MRRIPGIVGGVGYQPTLEYYSRMPAKYYERFGDMDYPEMVKRNIVPLRLVV